MASGVLVWAEKPVALRVTCELTEGSRLTGTTTLSSLPVRSEALGKLDIPLAKIRTIKFSRDHESVALTMTNGDSVKASLGKMRLQLQTVFGKVTVPLEQLLTMTVRAKGATGLDGLVLHYDFETLNDNEILDATGGNHPGHLRNVQIMEDGIKGAVARFSGEGSYVSFSDKGLPSGNSARTGSVWVKTRVNSLRQILFVYGAQVTGSACGLAIYENDPAPAVLEWTHLPPRAHHGHAQVSDGEWHQVVLVHDGDQTVSLYIDGALDLKINRAYQTNTGEIGYLSLNADGHGYIGLLDDFMVFEHALSATAVKALYDQQKPAHVAFSGDVK